MTTTVFAIETTGLYNWKSKPDDPAQPRIVAIAVGLYSARGDEQALFHAKLEPDGHVSSAAARDVHGVTERERELYGQDLRWCLGGLMRYTRKSDELVTFNMKFSRAVVESEILRLNADPSAWTRGGLKRVSVQDESAAKWNSGKLWDINAAHLAATGITYEKPEKDRHVKNLRATLRIMTELQRK